MDFSGKADLQGEEHAEHGSDAYHNGEQHQVIEGRGHEGGEDVPGDEDRNQRSTG